MGAIIRNSATGQVQLTWQDFIAMISSDEVTLRSLLMQALQQLPFKAFFWECSPVSNCTRTRRLFEFVAIRARHLENIEADPTPFDEHLRGLRGRPVATS